MLYGRPGVGKSTLALQLGCALASGEPKDWNWLGLPVKCPGDVLWVQMDMPRGEMTKLLLRAEKAQRWSRAHGLRALRIVDEEEPTPFDYPLDITKPVDFANEVYDFNILRAEDRDGFFSLVQTERPRMVIVDTVGDIYEGMGDRPLNEQARSVLTRLRQAIRPHGGTLIYLLHERKSSGQKGFVSADDPDNFMGAMQWMGFASTALQLVRKKRKQDGGNADDDSDDGDYKYWLRLRKCRLEQVGFDEIELTQDSHGFFLPKWTARQGLILWPWTIPPGLRNGASTKTDIITTLSRHLEVGEAAVANAWSKLANSPLSHKLPAHS